MPFLNICLSVAIPDAFSIHVFSLTYGYMGMGLLFQIFIMNLNGESYNTELLNSELYHN